MTDTPSSSDSTAPPRSGGNRTLLLLVTGALLVAFGWILSGGTVEADRPLTATPPSMDLPATVATIDGKEISLSELETAAAETLGQLDLQRQQMERKMDQERRNVLMAQLDRMIEDELIAMEAEARAMGSDALLAAEVTEKVEPVTDEQIVAFHTDLTQERQGVPPLERMRDQISSYLTRTNAEAARTTFLESLREKYAVERFLTEPRTEVATEGHPAFGPADAPVTIVEFSDFECPYCQRVVPTLDQIKKTYGDKVRIVFRQFPLTIHANAQKAAEASLCAHDQDRFWEMHDLLFEEQKQLGVAQLKEKAERLELDTEQFASCLDSGKYEEQVAQDVREGFVAGVSSTPSFFINGKPLTGAQPFRAVAAVIDEELNQAGQS